MLNVYDKVPVWFQAIFESGIASAAIVVALLNSACLCLISSVVTARKSQFLVM